MSELLPELENLIDQRILLELSIARIEKWLEEERGTALAATVRVMEKAHNIKSARLVDICDKIDDMIK